MTTTQERFYESRRLMWLDDLRRDLGYGVRSLRKSPGFAVIAILTLALGIGATTAIYSVVDTILLQPLPFANSDRLVRVVENYVTGGISSGRVFQRGVSHQQFLEWRTRTTTLEDVIAFPGAFRRWCEPTRARNDCGERESLPIRSRCSGRTPCLDGRSIQATKGTPMSSCLDSRRGDDYSAPILTSSANSWSFEAISGNWS